MKRTYELATKCAEEISNHKAVLIGGETALEEVATIIASHFEPMQKELDSKQKDINDLNRLLRDVGWGQGEIDSAACIAEENEQLQKRIEELEFKTSLEGYRAMGTQVAAALDERDDLKRQLNDAMKLFRHLYPDESTDTRPEYQSIGMVLQKLKANEAELKRQVAEHVAAHCVHNAELIELRNKVAELTKDKERVVCEFIKMADINCDNMEGADADDFDVAEQLMEYAMEQLAQLGVKYDPITRTRSAIDAAMKGQDK